MSIHPQLAGHALRRSNALERWINTNRTVPQPRAGQTPTAPVTSDLEEIFATARRHSQLGDRILRQLSDQVLIEGPVGCPNRPVYEGVDLARLNLEFREAGGVSALCD